MGMHNDEMAALKVVLSKSHPVYLLMRGAAGQSVMPVQCLCHAI